MKNSVIQHEGFYDDDIPLEILLPCDRTQPPLEKVACEWGTAEQVITVDYISQLWRKKVEHISTPLASNFCSIISHNYQPYSLLTYMGFLWVAFKHKSAMEEGTAHGNCILIQLFNPPLEDKIGEFERSSHLEVFQFLELFRNFTSGIPPVRYRASCAIVENSEAWNSTDGIENWFGSICITVASEGEHILYRQDGIWGVCWYDGVREITYEEFWSRYIVKEHALIV